MGECAENDNKRNDDDDGVVDVLVAFVGGVVVVVVVIEYFSKVTQLTFIVRWSLFRTRLWESNECEAV